MPKVISRSVIASSNETVGDSGATGLRVFYCLCGEFSLVCDRPLSACPVRPADGSYALRCLDTVPDAEGKVTKARVFKVNALQKGAQLVERVDGLIEKQYRFHCTRCDLPIGYETTPPPLKSGRFTYILKGALTEVQGRAPPDALLEDFVPPLGPAPPASATEAS